MASVSNNWLSLFVPALKKHAERTIMRPYLGSAENPEWGALTFREWDSLLAAATAHWRYTLASSSLSPGDVIGLWWDIPFSPRPTGV